MKTIIQLQMMAKTAFCPSVLWGKKRKDKHFNNKNMIVYNLLNLFAKTRQRKLRTEVSNWETGKYISQFSNTYEN